MASQPAEKAVQPAGDICVLVEYIVRALVDKPEAVLVRARDEQQGTVLELEVAPECVGKVIGRQGRTARALRTILGAAGMKLQKRISLEIVE